MEPIATPPHRSLVGRGDAGRIRLPRFRSILLFWLSVPLLVGGVGLLFTDVVTTATVLRLTAGALVFALAWSLVTTGVFRLTTRFNLENTRRAALVAILATTGVAVALVLAFMTANVITGFRQGAPFADPRLTFRLLVLRLFAPNVMIFAGVAGAGMAWESAARARARREQAVRLTAQNALLEAQLAEARLRVLRTQLNPHFLFNTLNTVSGLMDEDPRGARRMIARLSELLRFALQGATDAEIPVREEIRLVARYLEIVEIRYQGRLTTSIRVEPDVEDALVPSLILQPLAENAMVHGVAPAGGRGRIEVDICRSGDRLVLRVLDTGYGTETSREGGTVGMGIGLGHTRERLEALYGADQSLSLHPRLEGGTIAEIVLPFHTEPLLLPSEARSE